MSWITVKIKEYSDLYFPDECPNCLATPSDEIIRIQRTVGFNMFRVTYSIDCPFCKTCAEFFKQRDKIRSKFSIYTLVSLGLVILITMLLIEPLHLMGYEFIYPLIVLLITWLIIYLKYLDAVNKIPLNHGYVKRGEPIRIIRSGRKMLSDKYFLIISILNPKYAKLFIEKNTINNPKYNERTLKSSLDLLELKRQ
jgi:hypothetical protein